MSKIKDYIVSSVENAVDKVKALGGFIFDWRKDMMDKHSFAPDQEKKIRS